MSFSESIPPPSGPTAPTSMPVEAGASRAVRAPKPSRGSAGSSPNGGGSPRRFAPYVALAIAGLAVAILLIGPGGKDSGAPFSPIANAAERMQAYPGFEMNMTAKVDAPQAGASMTMSGKGIFNGATEQGRISLSANGPTGAFQLTELIDGETIYMNSPQFSSLMPGGADWMKFDLSAELSDSDQQLGSFDPSGQFEQLKSISSSVRSVGSEKVGNVVTTHYAATVDLSQSADAIRDSGDDATADQLETLVDAGRTSAPVDVWIDSKGLIRRMDMLVPLPLAGGPGASMSMSMTLSHFGIKPKIGFPAGASVFDGTELANQALDELD